MVKVKWPIKGKGKVDSGSDDNSSPVEKKDTSAQENALNPRAGTPGEGSSASPGKPEGVIPENEKPTGRDRKEYFKNYIIKPDDVGSNLFALIGMAEKSADKVTELSPVEKKYLDDLIFKGFVCHEIFLKEDFPVTFRSVPAIANIRAYDILSKEKGISRKLETLSSLVQLAVYLESYGRPGDGISFSHRGQTQEVFISEEKIEERYDFCREVISGIVIDNLNRRLLDFLNVLGRISFSQNIVNFSDAP